MLQASVRSRRTNDFPTYADHRAARLRTMQYMDQGIYLGCENIVPHAQPPVWAGGQFSQGYRELCALRPTNA
jgi:hypothetical protein